VVRGSRACCGSSLRTRCRSWRRWAIAYSVYRVGETGRWNVVGNVPSMAMKTVELIEDFYENTMGTPTHICQYKVGDDKKWIEEVVKK
jgi:singapore isolate B (sub-type 7) whole genome shotgun sequence assembly, scaffold_2